MPPHNSVHQLMCGGHSFVVFVLHQQSSRDGPVHGQVFGLHGFSCGASVAVFAGFVSGTQRADSCMSSFAHRACLLAANRLRIRATSVVHDVVLGWLVSVAAGDLRMHRGGAWVVLGIGWRDQARCGAGGRTGTRTTPSDAPVYASRSRADLPPAASELKPAPTTAS